MFKGPRRTGGFNIQTTLNTPIVIHKRAEPTHVSKDELMQFLDKFISEKELLVVSGSSTGTGTGIGGINSSITTTNDSTSTTTTTAMLSMDVALNSSLAQLKRIQRDFKGLPPLSYEEEEAEQQQQQQQQQQQ